MNTKMDEYIDSIKEWDIIDYFGNDYTVTEPNEYGALLIPTWEGNEETQQEESMLVTWGNIVDQTLDDEVSNF